MDLPLYHLVNSFCVKIKPTRYYKKVIVFWDLQKNSLLIVTTGLKVFWKTEGVSLNNMTHFCSITIWGGFHLPWHTAWEAYWSGRGFYSLCFFPSWAIEAQIPWERYVSTYLVRFPSAKNNTPNLFCFLWKQNLWYAKLLPRGIKSFGISIYFKRFFGCLAFLFLSFFG